MHTQSQRIREELSELMGHLIEFRMERSMYCDYQTMLKTRLLTAKYELLRDKAQSPEFNTWWLKIDRLMDAMPKFYFNKNIPAAPSDAQKIA